MKIIKKSMVLLMVLAALLLSGCAADHELKNLEVLTALGIDKDENGYLVYAQVLKAEQATNDSRSDSYRYFIGSGKSFDEAVESIYSQGSGELTFAHNKLYLFSYELLKDDDAVKEILLNTAYDIRPQSYCVVLKNEMKYFITAADEYGFDCCYKLLDILNENQNTPNVNDVLMALNGSKKNVLVPVAEEAGGVVGIERRLTVNSTGIVAEH